MNTKKIAAITMAAALTTAPVLAPVAFAQSGTMPTATTATTTATNPNTNSSRPSDTNPVLTDAGNVRASKVIGSSVYNDKDQKIGSVDDIILGKDNKPSEVVISVGGFLGMGSKLVAVPYDKLQFGNTRDNSDHRVMMPGATKDTVSAMSDYHYTNNS